MKYYLYISDAKVDMLFDQIPPRLRDNLATELKIDLKLISTTFSEGSKDKTRFTKAKFVTDYIMKHEKVGTVDEPDIFFTGTLPLIWGPLESSDGQMVYFSGTTPETLLGLGGSTKHIIGNVSNPAVSYPPYSVPPYMKDVLAKDLNLSLGSYDEDMLKQRPPDNNNYGALFLVARMAIERNYNSGTPQKLEFLAKRLIEGDDPSEIFHGKKSEKRVLLGSPIYVALAE